MFVSHLYFCFSELCVQLLSSLKKWIICFLVLLIRPFVCFVHSPHKMKSSWGFLHSLNCVLVTENFFISWLCHLFCEGLESCWESAYLCCTFECFLCFPSNSFRVLALTLRFFHLELMFVQVKIKILVHSSICRCTDCPAAFVEEAVCSPVCICQT